MALREIIQKFFIVSCYLNNRLNVNLYLSALSDNDDDNYITFYRFACACSNTLLCIMAQLGYCAQNERLGAIITEIMDIRASFEHVEEDIGHHIANFMRQNMNQLERHSVGVMKLLPQERKRHTEEEPEAGPSQRPRVDTGNAARNIPLIELSDAEEQPSEEEETDDASTRVLSPQSDGSAVYSPGTSIDDEDDDEEEDDDDEEEDDDDENDEQC